MKILFFEDLISRPHDVLRETFEFLGVAPDVRINTSDVRNRSGAPKSRWIAGTLNNPSLRRMARAVLPAAFVARVGARATELNAGAKPVLDERSREFIRERMRRPAAPRAPARSQASVAGLMPTSPHRNPAIARATTGAVWQLMGVLCLTGSSYVMVMLLARQLGPSAYGVFGVVYSVLLASELVMRLGVPQAITRLVAAGDPRATDIVATGLTINVAANLLALAVFWSVAPILADVLNVADGTRLFRIASLDLPFFAVYTYASHVLIGRHDFRINAIGTCAYGLTKVAGVVALLVTDQVGVAGALVVNIAASVVGLSCRDPRSRCNRLRPDAAQPGRGGWTGGADPADGPGRAGHARLDLWSRTLWDPGRRVKGVYAAALSLARVPNLLGSYWRPS
jgi:hypothetical protein